MRGGETQKMLHRNVLYLGTGAQVFTKKISTITTKRAALWPHKSRAGCEFTLMGTVLFFHWSAVSHDMGKDE